MGLFEKIFQQQKIGPIRAYFQMLNGYTPVWTTYEGGVYEMELTRSCVHGFASHASKLQPSVTGADLSNIGAMLKSKPNPFMVTSQFLYKCATYLEVANTCYIVPMFDQFDRIVGFYPIFPAMTELIEYQNEPWLRYTFLNGQKAAMELSRVGILHKFALHSDVVGDDNRALAPTMQLIQTQNDGISEGVKNNATYRFMATLANFSKGEDLAKERQKFNELNLATGKGEGGVLLFPNTYGNPTQIKNSLRVVDPDQVEAIENRVYNYFGCTEEVLKNKVNGEAWSAYYEGKIEPFAIQLSQVMTAMTYTPLQAARQNQIFWSSSTLQYMTAADKLAVSTGMFDRGLFSINKVMDIWNEPHVPGGDKRYLRKEYAEVGGAGDDPDNQDPSNPNQPATQIDSDPNAENL
jgi:hypothetical protein